MFLSFPDDLIYRHSAIRNLFILRPLNCAEVKTKRLGFFLQHFSPHSCRAVCTVFSTWLSEYPEDFKSLGEPSRLLRLAPLLPQDPSSATDLRDRLLRIAEELSEKALLPDAHKGL